MSGFPMFVSDWYILESGKDLMSIIAERKKSLNINLPVGITRNSKRHGYELLLIEGDKLCLTPGQ